MYPLPEVAAEVKVLGGEVCRRNAIRPVEREEQVAPGAGAVRRKRERVAQCGGGALPVPGFGEQSPQVVVSLWNACVELDCPPVQRHGGLDLVLAAIEVAQHDQRLRQRRSELA